MAKILTLEIPDNVYKPLQKKAKETGRTPEQFVSEWLKSALKKFTEDPLLQLAGSFESEVTNVSERHDDYIGENLRKDYE